MCGRFSLFAPQEDLSKRFGADVAFEYEPRYNIAPGTDIATIRNTDDGRVVAQEWGLLPHWADDTDEEPRPINARSETVAENNMFSHAFAERRCLVPADGFYEWRGERGSKQPYRIHLDENVPFAMAGLWNRFEANGETLETVTILTTEPNEVMEPIHDRMPVVLETDEENSWLHGTPDEALDVCGPYEGGEMEAYEISTAVNNPGNESADIVDPAEVEQSGLEDF
jgi:putative SOS response-associated peptidase YedK